MKKNLFILAAIAATSVTFTAPAVAQTGSDATTLYVDIDVERHEVVAGPYARYAQKYLGVAAPLADKVMYDITAAKILDRSEMPREISASALDDAPTHMNPRHGFPRLTVDKTSAAATGLEESARLAAEKIFEIRRSRLDLITGDVGENVFGGGLGSALKELDRLEDEYLSLFLGKESVRADTKQYTITPAKGRPTYTVCRFSDTVGLLPEDDLSGVPMVLELKYADGRITPQTAPETRPSSRAVPQLVPADMRCRIILDGVELTSETFRIKQLGEVTYINN